MSDNFALWPRNLLSDTKTITKSLIYVGKIVSNLKFFIILKEFIENVYSFCYIWFEFTKGLIWSSYLKYTLGTIFFFDTCNFYVLKVIIFVNSVKSNFYEMDFSLEHVSYCWQLYQCRVIFSHRNKNIHQKAHKRVRNYSNPSFRATNHLRPQSSVISRSNSAAGCKL